MIDLHSHILPGLDDGAKTMAETLQIIRYLHATGNYLPWQMQESIY